MRGDVGSTGRSAFRPDGGRGSAARFVPVPGIALGPTGLVRIHGDLEPTVAQTLESALVTGPALALVAAGYWIATR